MEREPSARSLGGVLPGGGVAAARDGAPSDNGADAHRPALERACACEEDFRAAKLRVLNNVAHELATPLTPIKLQLHLLRADPEGRLSEEQRKAVAILERNVERLGEFVDDALDAISLHSGRLAVVRRPTDLTLLALTAVEAFRPAAERKGLRLEARLDPDLPVLADSHRMLQAVGNLLHNAMKFTPCGRVVELATVRDGDQAVLHVHDEGAGLRAGDEAKLFELFNQVHDTMQQTIAGTGLGLFIARRIVELHGGRAWCSSPGPDAGSTFSIAIPLANGAHPDAEQPPAA